MSVGSAIQKAITAVLVTVAIALVIGQVLGQPVLIGYVETGSMVPTLEVGDGFIAIPTAIAGEVSNGDVVTFEAQSLAGGGFTTHRIVDETSEGYITQGDANAFTDQDNGEPPVKDAQIVAVVLQIGGEVVVLPSLGAAAMAVQGMVGSVIGVLGIGGGGGIGMTTTIGGVVLIVGSVLYDVLQSDGRSTSRSTRRSGVWSGWVVLAVVMIVLSLPLLTIMMLPSETTTVEILSADNPDESIVGQVKVGESKEVTYDVQNEQYLPKVVIIESESSGVEVMNRVIAISHGETKEASLILHAPDETGYYTRSRSEHHYLYVLPVPVIRLLHAIHPFIAQVILSVVAISPAVGLYLAVIGLRPISVRSVHR